MASQTQGIQQLLTAEKRAAEKVAEARKRNYFIQILAEHLFLIFFGNCKTKINVYFMARECKRLDFIQICGGDEFFMISFFTEK